MIDHIEVVRGQGSVLWGSDAIGGVINVVSRGPDSMFGDDYSSGEFHQTFNTADSASSSRLSIEGSSGNTGFYGGGSYLNDAMLTYYPVVYANPKTNNPVSGVAVYKFYNELPELSTISQEANEGKCLDLDHNEATNNTNLQLYDCNETSAQNWAFDGDYIRLQMLAATYAFRPLIGAKPVCVYPAHASHQAPLAELPASYTDSQPNDSAHRSH